LVWKTYSNYEAKGEHTLFIKYSLKGKLTLLLVCVDDMIIARDDEHEKLILKEKTCDSVREEGFWKIEVLPSDKSFVLEKGIFILKRKTCSRSF